MAGCDPRQTTGPCRTARWGGREGTMYDKLIIGIVLVAAGVAMLWGLWVMRPVARERRAQRKLAREALRAFNAQQRTMQARWELLNQQPRDRR